MPTYVTLFSWTDQGLKTVKDSVDRTEQARQAVEAQGGRVLSLYWTQGAYDFIATIDFPDEDLPVGIGERVKVEIAELGRDRIIRAAYDAVGIITFFTAGEPEVRGWNLERGATSVEAAGKIHTDLAKGFIRAEVTAFADMARVGTVKEVKANNLQRLEGKEYRVQDGDIIYFRSGL